MAKLTLEDLGDISELIEQAEMFKPVVRAAIDAFKGYTPEIDEAMTGIMDYMVDLKIRQVRRFEAAGFATSQAIELATSVTKDIKAALDQQRSKKT